MRKANRLIHTCFRKNHCRFVMGLVAMGINTLLLTYMAVLLQEIFDIAATGTINDIKRMIVKIIVYIAILGCGWIVENYSRNRFVECAMRQLKEEIFERITGKGIAAFSKESTGRYLSILTNDMNSIENNFMQSYFNITVNCCSFVMALLLMLLYDVRLTLVAVCFIFFSVVVSMISGGKLVGEEQKVSLRNEGFVGLVKDLLSGFSVIKSFRAEREITTLFVGKNKELERNKCHRRTTETNINIMASCMSICVQSGVMLTGAWFVMQGRITAGVLIAFVQLMNNLIQPIQQLPPALANRKAARGLFDKIAELTAANTEKESGTSISDVGKGIVLENVSFGYEEGQSILQDISLTFEKGKSYAIVGASGSGKSTLLNLLLGGHLNYEGGIKIGNQELRGVSSESLYRQMAIIQQNVFVFDDTIENNITMFKSFSREELETVIEKAGLGELVNEKGMDYRCGENGCNLSGGEKQRISIARGLLCNSSVLLMDEATSALDAATAAAIESRILGMEDMLRIVVTHKLNPQLLGAYDDIIVLQNGTVEACGNYEGLMRDCPYFDRLVQASC